MTTVTTAQPAANRAALDAAAPGEPVQGELQTQFRVATIVPSTFNAERRTVDVDWTAGARRRAYDWWSDTVYEEELEVSPEAVDMTRFDAGVVQVLDNHRVYGGVQAILGIATRGWIDGGIGRATLQLSSRDEVAGIVRDIQDGVIRSISFGYSVQRYEITRAQDRTDGVNLPLYRAVRWTPQEISFVTVPADPNASTRAQQGAGDPSATRAQPAGLPCEFVRAASAQHQQERSMPQTRTDEVTTTGANPAASPAPAAQPAAAANDDAQRAAAEASQRAADITQLVTQHRLDASLAVTLIREGATMDAARTRVLDELTRRDNAAGGHLNVRGIETVRDEVQTRLAGIEEMVMNRCDARAQLTDNGRQYRGMSLLEVGREHLERSGISTRGMTRMQLATQIMAFRSGGGMTTSDFASLLSNVANKRLRNGYTENPGSYQRWARRAPNAPDFKTMTVVQLGAAPDLLKTNEHGEFKYGNLTDGKETYSLLTYGRIVNFSRQSLINDDLRGFDRLVTAFGNSAARLENRTVYSILTANAALSDTVALFHATHANLAGSGAAIDVTTLGAGRTAMRKQKGLQSEELNIAPAFLIVPAALEGIAYQYTSANYVPATPANVNEFRAGGRTSLEPVVEAVLDANSATAWYLAANAGTVDTVEFCYLDGAEGPVIESEMGFEVDGLQMKARLDFAAKAIDYRGLYKNAGA
jgi:hypothetical protein